MEPVRPQVDASVHDWLNRDPVKREWFFKQRDGSCRPMGLLAARISETVTMWRQAVAPYANWVAHALGTIGSDSVRSHLVATPLNREAHGKPPLPTAKCPPRPECICQICGISIDPGKKLLPDLPDCLCYRTGRCGIIRRARCYSQRNSRRSARKRSASTTSSSKTGTGEPTGSADRGSSGQRIS
jgi:hypothetical protein